MNASLGPIAGRLKRPRWTDPRLVIGIALVAIAILGTASVVARADRTEPYYSARHTLTPGIVLQLSDVVVTHVRVGSGTYVPATAVPWGEVVTRVIGAGEMIPEASLADADAYALRPVAVTTGSPLAEAIESGAVVDVWVTRDGLSGLDSVLVAASVVVDQVDRDASAFSAHSGETVYVLIPAAEVGDLLAALAQADEVSVVGIGRGAA
jgi:hypothetical protein